MMVLDKSIAKKMEYIGLLALSAIEQVSSLKKEVEKLKKEIEDIKSR